MLEKERQGFSTMIKYINKKCRRTSKIIFIFAIKMHLQWKTCDGQILDKIGLYPF